VQAFIDSGAQVSVMSAECAKRCEVFDMVDEQFSAMLAGVGNKQSMGRVHSVPAQIQGNFFPLSVTVIDDMNDKNNIDVILGLDMMKRYRCQIDLEHGCLWFNGVTGKVAAPFLHEKDLPISKGVRVCLFVCVFVQPTNHHPQGVRMEGSLSPRAPSAVTGGDARFAPVAPPINNTKAQQITALGYSAEQALRALQQSNDDVEIAKTMLMFEPKKGT
jgi:DNA damage-inducible protein 1